LAAIEIWVLAGRVSKLVDEALAVKIVRGLADASPRAHGNVKGYIVVGEAVIRRVVARGLVEGGNRARRILVHCRPDLDRDRPSVCVERRAQAGDPHGAIGRADEVFLARPQQMNGRSPVLVGDVDRLFGLRAVAIASVAAAEVAQVEIDILLRNAGEL